MKWNDHQLEIFRCMRGSRGHIVVLARAGTGKTTTILEAIKHLPPGVRILLCAFNARIRDELKRRAPKGVKVMTLHGLGRSALSRGGYSCQVEKTKARDIAKELCSDEDGKVNYQLVRTVCRLVGLAKSTLVSTKEGFIDLIDDYDLSDTGDSVVVPTEILAELALAVLRLCKEDKSIIDFDDMIWFPCVHNVQPQKFDVVFVDEAQDLNAAQRWLVERAVKPGGRLIAVGDDRQAIYQFRGAGQDVLGDLTEQFRAAVMPLSVTYRCPKRIVEIAKSIVPDYMAAEEAPEGIVEHVNSAELTRRAAAPDFILSRASAPLMRTCLDLLAMGKPAIVAGKDLGRSLVALINKSETHTTAELEEWMQEFKKIERERLLPEHEKQFEAILDRLECIRVLSEGVPTVMALNRRIETLFTDEGDDSMRSKIVCSTVHKAKGLERPRVWLLDQTFRKGSSTEEDNIFYVAVTRAQSELYFVR